MPSDASVGRCRRDLSEANVFVLCAPLRHGLEEIVSELLLRVCVVLSVLRVSRVLRSLVLTVDFFISLRR